MVIRFVTLRHFLFADDAAELAVHLCDQTSGRRGRLLPEDPAHVVQQPCDGLEHQGIMLLRRPCSKK